MMEPHPTQRSSTLDKDPSKSDGLCDRSVTGDTDIDSWIWILEYFAKFKTELWMLHDVFETGPKLPDYLGEHTNEMVAFRCLATLFDCSTSGRSKDVVSDNKSRIEFDLSESCEYVLQCILDEIPLSELKPGAPGLSKWNLLPFLERKLLCLPKCALELMIEPSSQEDTGVSPCKGQECMSIDGKETDQVTSRMADPELTGRMEDRRSFGHGPGDGADEISRSHTLLERSNHGPGDGANEVTGSQASPERRDEVFPNESDGGVSIPSENRYRCIQCKESGKLLFCSGDECRVMVHERCLDEPPAYDDAGNFYCSLCAFTCASDKYLRSQDEVAKAKKKLVSFISLMLEVNKKKFIKGSSL